jgi:hypothetical protein
MMETKEVVIEEMTAIGAIAQAIVDSLKSKDENSQIYWDNFDQLCNLERRTKYVKPIIRDKFKELSAAEN